MKLRLTAAGLAALALVLGVAAGAGAAVIGLYRNNMDSEGLRAQIVKLSGERCARGGSETALRIFVGKETKECAYRTPVVGRDLDVAAIGRLLDITPKAVQRKAFLAVNLRAGGSGAGYQLAVFPLQGKAQLRKVNGEGRLEYLHIEKGLKTKGLNEANEIRLSAFNVTSGPERGSARLIGYVGKQMVADVTDSAAGELQDRASGVSLGAVGNAKGATGSFDDVIVRIPNPF